jgi:uncharacterized damage-inducible protein DinB
MREHVAILAARLAITHRQLADAVERVSDADRTWQPAPTSPSIAFHLWHAGRFADRWAAVISGAAQRWYREDLTVKWAFPAEQGAGDAGMELPDEQAATLPFPGRDPLATYLRGAFSDLEQAVGTLDDESVLRPADDLFGMQAPLLDSLTRHLAHVNRHLGMIEALRGLRGGHGTATV